MKVIEFLGVDKQCGLMLESGCCCTVVTTTTSKETPRARNTGQKAILGALWKTMWALCWSCGLDSQYCQKLINNMRIKLNISPKQKYKPWVKLSAPPNMSKKTHRRSVGMVAAFLFSFCFVNLTTFVYSLCISPTKQPFLSYPGHMIPFKLPRSTELSAL